MSPIFEQYENGANMTKLSFERVVTDLGIRMV